VKPWLRPVEVLTALRVPLTAVLALLAGPVAAAAAQGFQPPRATRPAPGTRLGLFGFGVYGGLDVGGPSQIVIGGSFDIGNLFIERVRLRAAGEVGIGGEDSFVASLETLFRFTGDAERTIPYVGVGMSIAGHDDCGMDPDCPDLWANLVFGFEMRFRATFNWMLEYHGMDVLRRHRFYLGFVTRRGG
jgi:hypothetical protein